MTYIFFFIFIDDNDDSEPHVVGENVRHASPTFVLMNPRFRFIDLD